MPYASIVVPAFNATATLQATLDSLTVQGFRDMEIVVVDDGSTDGTAEMTEAAARRDHRIRLVQQGNRGLAGARNSGIAAATGEVVGFCDADDLWMPGKLGTHTAHLKSEPQVGLSYSGSALIDTAGRLTGHAQRPRLHGVTAAHVLKRNPVGNGSAPVMRRAALDSLAWQPSHEQTRPWVFDETFRQSEDIECWLRLMLTTGWQIEGVPGALTLYRVNQGGLSANTERQFDAWQRMVDMLTPHNPTFFARQTPAARAYQLRYLARRALRLGQARRDALKFAAKGIITSPAGFFNSPRRGALTLIGALSTLILPARVSQFIFSR